ncbi:uncharacterized protein ARMOST_04411 [Armillaria ostoyae]|uniref:Ricin B lectin domain-containing protein n=1 Tax=Armillaria ostoyae TaxID=47428 RepID=A0A284QXD2_ARMOS|nr:uncharacterized protein ARMOST_04411 [Armillaria ostoyae]
MSSVPPLTRSESFASFVTAIMDDLKPGIYRIQLADPSLEKGNTHVDLSGQDLRTIIGFPGHDGDNQRWEFATLGAGYSIRSVYNGSYLSIDFKTLHEPRPHVVASSFPVSWDVKMYDAENGVYRIRWPDSEYVFSMGTQVDGLPPIFLSKQRSNADTSQLWCLRECEGVPLSLLTQPSPNTVVNFGDGAEGDIVITTTTITLTKVRRVVG